MCTSFNTPSDLGMKLLQKVSCSQYGLSIESIDDILRGTALSELITYQYVDEVDPPLIQDIRERFDPDVVSKVKSYKISHRGKAFLAQLDRTEAGPITAKPQEITHDDGPDPDGQSIFWYKGKPILFKSKNKRWKLLCCVWKGPKHSTPKSAVRQAVWPSKACGVESGLISTTISLLNSEELLESGTGLEMHENGERVYLSSQKSA